MDFRKKIGCAEAEEKDIVDYLVALGYHPVKISRNNYWFLSPLRNEKTASFKVNRTINRWFDFGIGEGGNLIDFAIHYHNCTVKEFLGTLNGFADQLQPTFRDKIDVSEEPKITILKEHILSSIPLLNYLHERRINILLADKYCKEISYKIGDKKYYAIGFQNDAGGYELRNKYFKGSSTPKDVTTLRYEAASLSVFEGFFDFLSYLTITEKTDNPATNFLILNSLSFFEKSIPSMLKYTRIHLFLNNDTAGQNCSRRACLIDKKFINESDMYKNYNDLNDMLTCKKSDTS